MLASFVQLRLARYTDTPTTSFDGDVPVASPVVADHLSSVSLDPLPFTQSAIRSVAVVAFNLAAPQACWLSSVSFLTPGVTGPSRSLQQRLRIQVQTLLASAASPQPGPLALSSASKRCRRPRKTRRHPLPGLSPRAVRLKSSWPKTGSYPSST